MKLGHILQKRPTELPRHSPSTYDLVQLDRATKASGDQGGHRQPSSVHQCNLSLFNSQWCAMVLRGLVQTPNRGVHTPHCHHRELPPTIFLFMGSELQLGEADGVGFVFGFSSVG